MPKFVPRLLLSAALLVSAVTAASAASLTRIETRPFYGAVVTEEEGVRVFRPLPPHRHIIINPDGRTPLNLTIEDRSVVMEHHYFAPPVEAVEGAGRFVGGYGAFLPYGRGGRHHRVRRSHPSRHLIHVPSRIPGVGRSRR
jgi:hypothetical protein